MIIGVLSDTHGHLDDRVFSAFEGVDHILHAGDIGTEKVIVELEAIAPVTAVRGNIDQDEIARRYPDRRTAYLGGKRIFISHTREMPKERCDAVIFGHTHKPFQERIGGVLHFNPGSAGRRPRSVGLLEIRDDGISGQIVALPDTDQGHGYTDLPETQPI